MNINNRKHVRFDTPSKSDPRLMNYQQPQPSAYFRDDYDVENSPKSEQNDLSILDNMYDDGRRYVENHNTLPNAFNHQMPDFNPPVRNLKQSISPKPSHELELSVLDSTPPDFMANAYKMVFPSEEKLPNDDTPKQSYFSISPKNLTNDEGLNKKMYQYDVPYNNLPSKTPLPKSMSTLPSNLLANITTVPAASNTKLKMDEKRETADGLGFFTLPNSVNYPTNRYDKSIPKQKMTDISKIKSQYNDVLEAKNNYQNKYPMLHNNDFQNHAEINEPQVPRCCNDKPPIPMPLPNVPIFNRPPHYQQNHNIPNYQTHVACAQNQKQSARCLQSFNNNYRQVTPVQPCCSYPVNNDVNKCIMQSHCAQQYINTTMQQSHKCQCRECHQYSGSDNSNRIPKPEDINNAVDLKRKAIESRLPKKESEDNNCNAIVQANASDLNTISNTIEKSEPTVSDLYQLIKMQNEQLQLLHQRVNTLLTVKESTNSTKKLTDDLVKPTHHLMSSQNEMLKKDNVNTNCIEQSMHKISIGVMTSFELVMSSNIVNKRDIVSHSNDKEVISNNHRDEFVQTSQIFENIEILKNQMCTNPKIIDNTVKNGCGINFLDGIAHCNKGNDPSFLFRNSNGIVTSTKVLNDIQNNSYTELDRHGNDYVEENALRSEYNQYKTPMQLQNDARQVAPNTSFHLHMDGYNTDSDDECSEPNAGWTFYNNVMNRVNDMLHSPLPNSDGIGKEATPQNYRFLPEHMQRISSANRPKTVTHVDSPQSQPVHHNIKPISETSLHMKRLAAKYLSSDSNDEPMRHESKVTFSPHVNIVTPVQHYSPYVGDMGNEMSFATLQYMKRYHLMSVNGESNHLTRSAKKSNPIASPEYLKPIYKNPSRILDITTLKQQPKLM